MRPLFGRLALVSGSGFSLTIRDGTSEISTFGPTIEPSRRRHACGPNSPFRSATVPLTLNDLQTRAKSCANLLPSHLIARRLNCHNDLRPKKSGPRLGPRADNCSEPARSICRTGPRRDESPRATVLACSCPYIRYGSFIDHGIFRDSTVSSLTSLLMQGISHKPLARFLPAESNATEHYTTVSKDCSMTGHSAEDRDQSHSDTEVHAPARLEEALRSALSDRLGATKFSLWFGGNVRLGLNRERDSLIVRVPDRFFRDWIERHFTSNLIEAVEAVLGHRLGVSFQVHGESEQHPTNAGGLESKLSERTKQPRVLEGFPTSLPGNSMVPVPLHPSADCSHFLDKSRVGNGAARAE